MAKKAATKSQKEEPAVLRSPNFLKFYATNVQGGPTTQDFRFQLMNEKLLTDHGWHLVSDALVILTPAAAKRLHKLLSDYVLDYEKKQGSIITEFEKEPTY